jgi:hypothetical protein
LALTFAGSWLRQRRRASDSSNLLGGRKRGASKDINRVLRDMETAARAGDAASFFALARGALEAGPRTALEGGPHTALEAGARTELEGGRLEAGLGGGTDDIRRFLALADEVSYAGLRPTREEFERWLQFMRVAFQRDEFPRGKSS